GCIEIIQLAERTIEFLEQYRNLNQPMLNKFPKREAFWVFLASFLRKQIQHIKTIILLESEINPDSVLTARSMLEGSAQVYWVLSSIDPKALALKWCRYRYQ